MIQKYEGAYHSAHSVGQYAFDRDVGANGGGARVDDQLRHGQLFECDIKSGVEGLRSYFLKIK